MDVPVPPPAAVDEGLLVDEFFVEEPQAESSRAPKATAPTIAVARPTIGRRRATRLDSVLLKRCLVRNMGVPPY
jgi:hypothetical protein